jgi:hypothetical protein
MPSVPGVMGTFYFGMGAACRRRLLRGVTRGLLHMHITRAPWCLPQMSPPNPIAITLLASLVRLLLPWSQGPLTVC